MINRIPAIKVGMASAFDGAGTTVPVTLLRPYQVVVTEIKRPETHGYAAAQCAYGETLAKRVNKPKRGVLKRAGVEQPLAYFYEARIAPAELGDLEIGKPIDMVELVKDWETVKITGTSKGKGFAGVVKRYHFAGQQRTHGDPDNRRPMSNNATDPARVFKGSRRPGRMGNAQVTLSNATVYEYDSSLNLLAITGSVPGPDGGRVFVTLVSRRAAEGEEG